MNASALFAAGYTDLVCVVPPGAELAENTTLDPADLGKTPGKRGADGKWHGYHWRGESATRQAVTSWDQWGSNVGLRGDRFPAVDIDVDDEQLARVVVQWAARLLGPAPIRRSTGSRRLMPYRTEQPFPRVALVMTWRGRSHKVEILAAGRQYLVEGTHPSGQQYRWEGPPLHAGAPPERRLAPITREKVDAFLTKLEGELRRINGMELERVGGGPAVEVEPPPQDELFAPSLQELEELVARIPNREEDRDGYVRVGHAIRAAGGAEAAHVFAEWASRWEDGHNDPETVERDYAGFRGPYRIGWDWLKRYAEETAPIDPRDEFEADPEAERPEQVALPLDTSEDGVSQFLAPLLKDRLKYIPAKADNGQWLVWDRHRWERDETLQHKDIVTAELRRLCYAWRALAANAPGKEGAPYLRAANAYSSNAGVRNIVSMLQPNGVIVSRENKFDLSQWELNTPTGIVDLRSGAVRPSTPADMMTRSTAVAPAAGPMPLFERFLNDATGGDVELQRFMQRMFGYALTGDTSAKAFWFVWGEADTGKSTFIRVIDKVFGSYADSVDIEAFIGSNPGRIPADLARLPGVRLVTATEPPANRAWDEKRIKAITGGDQIEARFLYGQPFVYTPQFKVVVIGNHEPEIRNVDAAMLRRVQIVPINVPVPRERQIDNLSDRIFEEEGPQVLQWLIEGCMEYQHVGLQPPACVQAKTKEYSETEDIVAQFLHEECVVDEDAEISRNELFQQWSMWCRARGYDAGAEKGMKRLFAPFERKMGFRDAQITKRHVAGYRGLRLADMTEVA